MALSIINIIFCISFVSFAYVNLNDKDGWLWVSIYMLAALLCGLAAFKKFYPSAYLVTIVLYLVYAGFLFFSKDGVLEWIVKHKTPNIAETMQATKPYIEKTREFFGLVIVTIALAINYFAGR